MDERLTSQSLGWLAGKQVEVLVPSGSGSIKGTVVVADQFTVVLEVADGPYGTAYTSLNMNRVIGYNVVISKEPSPQ